MHRLQNDKDAYFDELQRIVDAGFLNNACNESGICKELRIAQDELYSISPANSSEDLTSIRELADHIEAYESSFVEAVREFLSKAKGVDLTAVTSENELMNTQEVTAAFEERLRSLSEIQSSIDLLLHKLREISYA